MYSKNIMLTSRSLFRSFQKLDLPGHCYVPSKNWTFPVTVMVLLKKAPGVRPGPALFFGSRPGPLALDHHDHDHDDDDHDQDDDDYVVTT